MRDTAGVANEDDPTSQLADTVGLRILATTDMHMKLLPHDYLADRPCRQGSLAQISSLVDKRRAGWNTLLLDNGDFLQGTPLGDQAAQAGGRHPAIAAMNQMGYDAAAIGNHDFAFGLDVLQAAARQARREEVRPPGGRVDHPAREPLSERGLQLERACPRRSGARSHPPLPEGLNHE